MHQFGEPEEVLRLEEVPAPVRRPRRAAGACRGDDPQLQRRRRRARSLPNRVPASPLHPRDGGARLRRGGRDGRRGLARQAGGRRAERRLRGICGARRRPRRDGLRDAVGVGAGGCTGRGRLLPVPRVVAGPARAREGPGGRDGVDPCRRRRGRLRSRAAGHAGRRTGDRDGRIGGESRVLPVPRRRPGDQLPRHRLRAGGPQCDRRPWGRRGVRLARW